MQHVEIPNAISEKTENYLDANNPERTLQKGDKVIYAAIRRNMDDITRSCYPSIETIKKLAGCGQNKVYESTKRLADAGFIKVGTKITPSGRTSKLYIFPKTDFDKRFEMFTFDFLDLDLPTNVKEYYMDVQQYLYGKDSGIGKCTYSNVKLAELTGWSVPAVKKYNKILIENNLLTEESLTKTDEAGLPIVQKNFNLTGLQQAALWVKAVTEQVTKNTDDIEIIKQENEEMKSQISELQRKMKIYEKERSLERNTSTSEVSFNF